MAAIRREMFNTQVKGDQLEIRTVGTRITLVNKVTHNLMHEPLNLRPPAVPSPHMQHLSKFVSI